MRCDCGKCKIACKKIGDSSLLLKAVAEPNRLRILCMLDESPMCVGELSAKLHLPNNLVSFHLKNLLEVNVLEKERDGNKSVYSIQKDMEDSVKSFLKLSAN